MAGTTKLRDCIVFHAYFSPKQAVVSRSVVTRRPVSTPTSKNNITHSGTLAQTQQNEMYLDKLRVEKERGITVKAQTASMLHIYDNETYLLNLIDTPGHVDFSYEVSRSMASCEGALLLVDAAKGIQAQSIANWWLAKQNNLAMIPVINKIDLHTAQPAKVAADLQNTLNFKPNEILQVSALSGIGIEQICPSIVENIPPPTCQTDGPFRALLFDSWYQDTFSGVICLIKVADGSVSVGDKIVAASTKKTYQVVEVGIMFPELYSTGVLYSGQVGYIKIGMKSAQEARVGDTFYHEEKVVPLFPSYQPVKPMVYAGLYPDVNSDFNALCNAMNKLLLTDASVTTTRNVNNVLGMGYRCGFLGLLHMDVFLQRLREEYNTKVIVTAPSVSVRVELRSGEQIEVTQTSAFPPREQIKQTFEPFVRASLFVPKQYLGTITNLCIERRSTLINTEWIDTKCVRLTYHMPLSEVIFDFFDQVKQLSSGYATLDYEETGYEPSDLVKLDILLNGEVAEPLSVICHRSKAETLGRKIASKLKTTIPRQMFEIRVQAAIGSKIVARENINPFRKDVTAKCYGGDGTRKQKLLEKQKEGKKRMKSVGNVELPPEAFMAVIKI
ncbi:uncharacterized protein LOC126325933 isoform X2 [Schistocerca gregaria]|uniref:uncharacterized protein LOC126325933 isoform X2 n=1 Tax=Schistocerca gregaria TaxID=7010 RepID=UPI00211E07FF|nr:uncharacterized protein LOC126325933 isoform X2 [Schistocerca gregaria]